VLHFGHELLRGLAEARPGHRPAHHGIRDQVHLEDAGEDAQPQGCSVSQPPPAYGFATSHPGLTHPRETLSKSVEVWIWLTRDFAAAIPSLTTRSIGPLASLNDPDKGVTPLESTALITKNYPSLKEDLQLLIKLMHIARNLLVVPEPEIPQDLCAAAQFDQMLYQTIILCINVTSKAYDGDVLEEAARLKLSEITELCEFPSIDLASLSC